MSVIDRLPEMNLDFDSSGIRNNGAITNAVSLEDPEQLVSVLTSMLPDLIDLDVDRPLVAQQLSELTWDALSVSPQDARERRLLLSWLINSTAHFDNSGWPYCRSMYHYYQSVPDATVGYVHAQVPTTVGTLTIGNYETLVDRELSCDAVISLCRTGYEDAEHVPRHAEVWLNDVAQPELNPLGPRLAHNAALHASARLRLGESVLIHCAVGRSRSPAVAALVLEMLEGISFSCASEVVRGALPSVKPLQLRL